MTSPAPDNMQLKTIGISGIRYYKRQKYSTISRFLD